MRQIKAKEEIEKSRKTRQLVIGTALICVMVLGTIGFAFFNEDWGNKKPQKITYNGFEFLQMQNNLWSAQIQGNEITTFYNPQETENISFNFALELSEFYGRPVYFILSNQEAASEILGTLGNYVSRVQTEVCLEGQECSSPNYVRKNCSNNIFIFRESEKINLYKQENCVFIEAPYNEQVKASDRIIFKILGVQ